MNKPIINPLWIYLANVIPNVGVTCIVLGILGFLVLAILFFAMTMDIECDIEDEEFMQVLRMLKKYIWIPCVLMLFGSLIPEQETIYGMMAANYITPSNIEAVGNSAKDVVDYIFEKIDESDKEQKNDN